MKVFALISLLSSLYVFVTAVFAVTIHPDKGLKQGEWKDLDEHEKKMRLVWFVFGSLAPMIFSIFCLLNN